MGVARVDTAAFTSAYMEKAGLILWSVVGAQAQS